MNAFLPRTVALACLLASLLVAAPSRADEPSGDDSRTPIPLQLVRDDGIVINPGQRCPSKGSFVYCVCSRDGSTVVKGQYCR